jgi:uncharacterized protein YkwD
MNDFRSRRFWVFLGLALLGVGLLALLAPAGGPLNAAAGRAAPGVAPGAAPTAAQVIEAVNTLRLENGLNALSTHPALSQQAQIEADGIAAGAPGHWRPDGMTLGQWLISLGYPLAGDLTQDGYRSENWQLVSSAAEAVQAWLGDGEHTNTMLSPNRSDLGVGIAASDGAYVVVLTTALQTSSGQQQAAAAPLLTQAAGGDFQAGISQWIKPVVLSTARPSGDVFHKVEYGQTLWSIAEVYHTPVEQLRAWNNLVIESTIYEGQLLLVGRGATQPPPPSATPRATATLRSTPAARQVTASPAAQLVSAAPAQAGRGGLSPVLRAVLFVGCLVVAALALTWVMRRAS